MNTASDCEVQLGLGTLALSCFQLPKGNGGFDSGRDLPGTSKARHVFPEDRKTRTSSGCETWQRPLEGLYLGRDHMAFPPGAAVLRAPDAGSGMGSAGLARLHGLFAAYKPPGLKWKHLRDTVELQLLKGLNAGKPPAPEQRVRFLLGPVEGSEEKELTLTATTVPSLINHPLVRGPAFTSLKVGVGHRLDAQASGVLVLGVGHGRRLLTDMYNAHLTKPILQMRKLRPRKCHLLRVTQPLSGGAGILSWICLTPAPDCILCLRLRSRHHCFGF
uniref:Uncharacterized protein n=1 Tax=Sus scrofa TaxID=9823 RepID=A0A8D1JYQ9_PIG